MVYNLHNVSKLLCPYNCSLHLLYINLADSINNKIRFNFDPCIQCFQQYEPFISRDKHHVHLIASMSSPRSSYLKLEPSADEAKVLFGHIVSMGVLSRLNVLIDELKSIIYLIRIDLILCKT